MADAAIRKKPRPKNLDLKTIRLPVLDIYYRAGGLMLMNPIIAPGLLLGAAFRVFARLQNERWAASAYCTVQAFAVPLIYTSDPNAKPQECKGRQR